MQKIWSGSDDAFFQGLFAYLKRKFEVRFSVVMAMQKNTEKSIYLESIVALEGVHEVLRKIENSSAPTREDYEKACNESNQERKQEIIDFYKKLALLNDREFAAFQNFRRYYYFDSVISRYSVFLDDYTNPNLDEDKNKDKNGETDQTSEIDHHPKISPHKFSELLRVWNQKNFDANEVFYFIEAYQAILSESSPSTKDDRYRWIRESIHQQNSMYEKLIRDYDVLIDNVKQIGVSVLDVIVPCSLRSYEHRPEFLSTELLSKVVCELEDAFRYNDGILFIVNHAHVRSKNDFVLSYLVIYKSKIYEDPTQIVEWIKKEVAGITGRVYYQPKVIGREDMLRSLYPNETFVGALSSSKQKIAFRDKFLRYFLSSIFLIHLDESEELEYWKTLKKITLNDYIFYKEKIYIEEKKTERKTANSKNETDGQPNEKPIIEYLSELVRGIQSDQFFSNKELPTDAILHLELISFLYRQQDITRVPERTIDDLIQIESFLVRLMYLPIYEFSKTCRQRDFERAPTFKQLSLLFQQFLLILQMKYFEGRDKEPLPKELHSKAICFVNQFNASFKKDYRISQTYILKRDLEDYKRKLRLMVQHEQKVLHKHDKRIASIQNYLAQVLKKDVVILRFIFKCGRLDSGEAKKFDDMFRDYSNNLKRRYTKGFRLVGQVGVYIPHRQEHYIDATLIFQNDQQVSDRIKAERDIETLKDEVALYWENYVKKKWEQIEEHKKKQKNSKLKSDVNPFSCFENRKLTAWSVAVVKTEPSLDQYEVEIFQGQHKIQKLFIAKIASYYAYSPVILVRETECESMLRTSRLILGRIREPHQKKPDVDDLTTHLEQQENLSVENAGPETNSQMEPQPIVLPSGQAEIITETDMSLPPVQQADDEQATNNELDLQGAQSNELDENVVLTMDPTESHIDQTGKNTMKSVNVEIRRKLVGTQPIINKPKGS